MKTKLSEGWKEVKLGDVAEFINGRAFKPSEWEDKGKIIIRIQDLTGNIENPNYTTQTFDERYLVKKGDLLISWSATLDAFIWNKEDGWLNQHIFKVVENNKLIYRKFLFYLVKNKIEDFKKETHGSTMKHITKGDFNSIKFLLPPLEVQKHIISILEQAEKLKEKREDADNLTKEYLQSVFYNMFLNKEFKEIELGNDKICEVSGQYGSGASAKEYDGNIRYIRITDIDEDGNLRDEKVSPNKVEEKYFLQNGDLLFARSGATVGKTYLCYNKNKKFQFAGYLILFRFKKNIVKPEYVYYYTKTNKYLSWVQSKMKVVAQPNINSQQYSSILIPLPPLELQNKFVAIVKQIEILKEKQEQSKQEINLMFDSLMKQAFNGELIR